MSELPVMGSPWASIGPLGFVFVFFFFFSDFSSNFFWGFFFFFGLKVEQITDNFFFF